jgi:DNA-directed RNA polymerase I subunit RPA12
MNFCKQCNNLLPTPNTDTIVCRCCGAKSTWADAPASCLNRLTLNGKRPEPDWLLRRKRIIGLDSQEQQQHAIVDEPCPQCQFPQAKFYTLQLRSVDEGSTVFYECLSCKFKWNQDN